MSEISYKTYHRMIVSTGQIEKLPFTHAQLGFTNPDKSRLPYGVDQLTALKLVNQWNILSFTSPNQYGIVYWLE